MRLKYKKIRYKNRHYAILEINKKDNIIPVLLEWEDFRTIRNLGKTFEYTVNHCVSCYHTNNSDITRKVYIHQLAMGLKQRSFGETARKEHIIHINRLGIDNRHENLCYDTINKKYNKNKNKKKRTLILPENSDIDVDKIPSFIWYMKPNGNHGDRFMIKINDYSWKTSSSKKLSLTSKLDQAKRKMKEIKKTNPELFEDLSMNGDLTLHGKKLLDSFYKIISRAGYKYEKDNDQNNTKTLLKLT